MLQELRKQSGDWKRDWSHIAQTEMWDAKLQGEAVAIQDKVADAVVFKRPAADACAKCKQLYLESDGVTPKLFRMSDLLSHGTNYGKNKVIGFQLGA